MLKSILLMFSFLRDISNAKDCLSSNIGLGYETGKLITQKAKLNISVLFVQKVILITQALYGAQEIYYTQNNRNEFNFVDTWIILLEAQEPQSNDTKSEEFANPTFF
jgi:hypothetical protein